MTNTSRLIKSETFDDVVVETYFAPWRPVSSQFGVRMFDTIEGSHDLCGPISFFGSEELALAYHTKCASGFLHA